MEATKPKKRASLSSSMQKALFFCAVLVFSALIYVLISMNAHAKEAVPEPIAATPTPANTPGLRAAVVLERLKDAGFSLEAEDESANIFTISTDAFSDDVQDTLQLFAQGGYIKGFSLYFNLAPYKKGASSKSEIEHALQQRFNDDAAAVEERVRLILPDVLNSVSPEGYFPQSTALACVNLSTSTLNTGKLGRETQHGFSFTAMLVENEGLVLAADIE